MLVSEAEDKECKDSNPLTMRDIDKDRDWNRDRDGNLCVCVFV